jgi:hypothetical protein
MTCDECDRIQNAPRDRDCFVRIDTSNVLIVGCDKHLKRTIALINIGRDNE